MYIEFVNDTASSMFRNQMKKHPVLFKICLILLLFGIASVQALKDNDDCEYRDSEGICQKTAEEMIRQTFDEEDDGKSVFTETHDCKVAGNTADGVHSDDISEGSCIRKDLEDEDQSELSMFTAEFCGLGDDNCGETPLEEDLESNKDIEDSNEERIEASVDQRIDEGRQLPDEELENEGEVEKSNQDPDLENVPLREILLKLKPEGLTDNEEEVPNDFSVTEASMGEYGEVEEGMLDSSGSPEKQEYGLDGSSADGNKNGSGTGSSVSKKAVCSELNVTEPAGDVEIINATLLMKLLQGNSNVTNRSISATCHLIYFFSPYCPFSVAGSPYVNAMARSLKNIPVYGLDSIEHHSVNARYGVMGTPTLLLFHNGNGVGRYNASEFSVMQLLSFINHYTDQSITDINVTSADFRATLPSQIAEGRPYALWASWIFLLICAEWLFLTSELCAKLTEAILNNWREAEAQNDQD
ncbi:thioredoxin domain-containing protein 15 isoform X2 [Palaemon carinicauda]|uniref:thioredoxin domain-containing protein 15 isoform X2 n=1 Tax=Palaemon carinicauda TaxID=392227 RepID=UPI0035B5CA79